MGRIIETRVTPSRKIKMKIIVDTNEAIALGGNFRKIHAFTEKLSNTPTRIIEKGSKGVAKYFEVPKLFKIRPYKINNLNIQAIETASKLIVIYVCDKPGKPF